MSRWQFVLHQQALEEIDTLRPAERREVRRLYYVWPKIRGKNPTRKSVHQMIAFIW